MIKATSVLVTTIFVLNPVLSMYGTGIESLSLFDVLLFIPLFLVFTIKSVSSSPSLLPIRQLNLYVATVLVLSTFNMVYVDQTAVTEVLLRTMRYLLYLTYLFYFSKTFFDIEFAKKLFRWLVLFATIYLFYQYLSLFIFGRYPRGYVEFLPLMRPGLRAHFIGAAAESWFRPRSIFGEPSQYGIVAGTYLIWSLSEEKRVSWDKLFIVAGLAISASGTAYLILLFALFVWIHNLVSKYSRFGLSTYLTTFIIFILLGGIVYSVLSLLAGNIINEFIFRGLRRLGGFADISIFFKYPIINTIFGLGMRIDVFESWPSSVVRVIYYFGLFGLASYILLLILLWKQTHYQWQKMMVIVLFLFSVGNEVSVSSPLLFSILPLIVYNGYKNNYKEQYVT